MKQPLLIVFVILGLWSYSESTNSNQLDSDDYASKEQRIEELKKQIIPKSEFYDAEFELFNVNGFNDKRVVVPGASSWDYKFAIKVQTEDIDKWTKDLIYVKPNLARMEWINGVIENRKENWIVKSDPQCYSNLENDIYLVAYLDEGVIFERIINE